MGATGPSSPTCSPRRKNSAKIVRQRKKEREKSGGQSKAVCVWWLIPDQEFASVVWRSINDEYQRQGEGLGEGLEHSRANAQGEWDGPNHPTMAEVEFRVGYGRIGGSRPISSHFLKITLDQSGRVLFVSSGCHRWCPEYGRSDQDRGKAKEP
ncbi:hypothetical protein Bca101_026360 [Brassica carinata]